MKNKISFLSILILASLISFISISALAAFGNSYKVVLGSLIYFFGVYLTLKRFNIISKEIQFTILILPPLLIFLFVNILNFDKALISFPSNLCLLIGAFAGFLYYNKNSIIYPATLLLIIGFWTFLGQNLYLNKLNYGSFNKEVILRLPKYEFFDSSEKKITLNSKSKKIILDFWNSKCGFCYETFPYIDSVSKIIDTSKYEIFVVNIPIAKEIFNDNFKLLDKYNYKFNQLFAKNMDFLDSINTNSFPTTIILENENIIYKGDFATALNKIN